MNELAPPPDNGVPVHEHPLDHQSVQTSTQSKGKAGRTLDGVTHDGYPGVPA